MWTNPSCKYMRAGINGRVQNPMKICKISLMKTNQLSTVTHVQTYNKKSKGMFFLDILKSITGPPVVMIHVRFQVYPFLL